MTYSRHDPEFNIIYTPSDWQIFRESPIPVMIVAENKWRQKNNILCAIDLGSKKNYQKQLNRKLIEQGKALAEMLKGKLTGNTAGQVIHYLRTDLLTLKP